MPNSEGNVLKIDFSRPKSVPVSNARWTEADWGVVYKEAAKVRTRKPTVTRKAVRKER